MKSKTERMLMTLEDKEMKLVKRIQLSQSIANSAKK